MAGTLLLVVGIQFISLGVIGEILSRTYLHLAKKSLISLDGIQMTKNNLFFSVAFLISIIFARVSFDIINQSKFTSTAQYWVWSQNLSLVISQRTISSFFNSFFKFNFWPIVFRT